jgi:hypothetical protein
MAEKIMPKTVSMYGEMSAKQFPRESQLRCCEIVHSASGLWNWQDFEYDAILDMDAKRIGEIILRRLDDGNCGVTDAYVSVFDEYNVRFIACFANRNGVKLSQVASLAGVDVFSVRKSEKGRYGYRQLLARFVCAKADGSFSYPAESVVTLRGRNYLECFNEYKADWLRSLAGHVDGNVEIAAVNHEELVSLVDCINENDILHYCDLSDVILTRKPELFNSVMANSLWLRAYLKSRAEKLMSE